MTYGLLAIDVDGTLIGTDGVVAREVVEAIQQAEAAGLRVCLATGRSYAETVPVWRQLRLQAPYQPLVLIGGALVSEPDTGRTLWQRTIRPDLACEFAESLGQEGYSAMAIVDAWRHGVDYFFIPGDDERQAHSRWFAQMDVKVRRVGRLPDAADAPQALRISAVVAPDQAAGLAERLIRRFQGRLNVHPILAPNYGVTIVEAFAASADKAAGVSYVAQALGLGRDKIVAVGDDVNDLPMIRAAGLGVAMAAAPPAVRAAARHVTQDGLAGFVRDLLSGRFD